MFTPHQNEPEDAPIARIANAVLGYAILDGAYAIHIAKPNGKGQVLFRLRHDELWHEKIKVPFHIIDPLIARFQQMTNDQGAFSLCLKAAEQQFSLLCEVTITQQTDADGTQTILSLESKIKQDT